MKVANALLLATLLPSERKSLTLAYLAEKKLNFTSLMKDIERQLGVIRASSAMGPQDVCILYDTLFSTTIQQHNQAQGIIIHCVSHGDSDVCFVLKTCFHSSSFCSKTT